MNGYMTTFVATSLIGAGLVGGVFFAFSSFVMRALAQLPPAHGIAAMQAINATVLNRSFLGAFLGTAAASLMAAVAAVLAWDSHAAPWLLAGALAYLVGTVGVTMFGNVPLNERLAKTTSDTADAAPLFERYVQRWTRLNTLRTLASTAAAALFAIALARLGT